MDMVPSFNMRALQISFSSGILIIVRSRALKMVLKWELLMIAASYVNNTFSIVRQFLLNSR